MFGWVMQANYAHLDKDVIRKKIGSMYLGVCLEEDKVTVYGLCHSVMFLLRRSVFVAITFAFYD